MVCYNSMSHLPSSSSILGSTSSSFSFYALLFFLLPSTPHHVQLLFCLLCYVLPLHPLHYTIDLPFILCTASLPTHIPHHKKITLSSLFYMYFSHQFLSTRSSWKLFVFSGGYSKSVHHQWSLSKYSLASLAVATLRLLCQLQLVNYGFFGF